MTASPAVETGRFTCGHNEYELSITPNSDNVSAPRAVANFNCNLKFEIRNVELVWVARQLTKLFPRF